jgi:hypothetical protein
MTSSRTTARLAGFFYLILCLSAAFAFLIVQNPLVVSDDPATTAKNIAENETLYRAGFVAGLITLVADAVVAILFYELLKPVSRSLSLLAAAFRLIFVAVMAFNSINYYLPLLVLHPPPYLQAFTTAQLQSLMLMSRRLFGAGYDISEIFFAIHCVLIGYLFFKSNFASRILGAFAISGSIYMTLTLLHFLAPALARPIQPWLLWPAGITEWVMALWLLIVGVKEPSTP